MDYNQFINLDYFFYKIYQLFVWLWNITFGLLFDTPLGGGGDSNFLSRLLQSGGFFRALSEILTILFLTSIIYCLIRVYEIQKEDREKLDKIPVAIDDSPYKNKQWEVVLEHMNSDGPADWRMAIIEADNMLDEMVKKLGYEGEDLGERLKAVEPSDFESLNSAWEAHKVRNQIVHEGVGFEITKSDAERVIQLYEKVFREFDFI
mgnify:CR=1 FL=1